MKQRITKTVRGCRYILTARIRENEIRNYSIESCGHRPLFAM